jgi:hypothetical protein
MEGDSFESTLLDITWKGRHQSKNENTRPSLSRLPLTHKKVSRGNPLGSNPSSKDFWWPKSPVKIWRVPERPKPIQIRMTEANPSKLFYREVGDHLSRGRPMKGDCIFPRLTPRNLTVPTTRSTLDQACIHPIVQYTRHRQPGSRELVPTDWTPLVTSDIPDVRMGNGPVRVVVGMLYTVMLSPLPVEKSH